MIVTADTNILIRLVLNDNEEQAAKARKVLEAADTILIPIAVFCELAWVCARSYKRSRSEICAIIEDVFSIKGALVDRSLVEAGLETLRNGGDFADGAIAAAGFAEGSELFVTFDRKAARVLSAQGFQTLVP